MIHISKYCDLCIFVLDTQILFNLQVQQQRASGTDHKHRKRLQENTWYSPLDSDLRKLSTVLPKSWSASDWNSYPQLRKSLTPKTPPPQFFPVLSQKNPLGPRCILPAQHLLSPVPGHQISKPGSPPQSSGNCLSWPVWNAVAAVPLWPALYGTAPLQRVHKNLCSRNDTKRLLCTSKSSSA